MSSVLRTAGKVATRDDLRIRLSVALSVFPTTPQRALGITAESARERLVEELVFRSMGSPESEALILEPSNVGPMHAPWRGRWGEDEPHPMERL